MSKHEQTDGIVFHLCCLHLCVMYASMVLVVVSHYHSSGLVSIFVAVGSFVLCV